MPNDQKNPPDLPVAAHEEAVILPPEPQKRTPFTVVPSEPIDPEWQRLTEAFQMNRRSLLGIPGVTAVDIGYKVVKGAFQNDLAIRVHVKRKLPESAFRDRPHDYFRKAGEAKRKIYFKLKGGYDDVPTDVIEANYGLAHKAEPPRPGAALEKPQEADQVDPRRRLDPLVGGISIGSPETPAGTLGALVWDNKDGSVCILSNWHVLSGDLGAEAGTPCFQPGRLDQGRSSDVVAHLKRWSFDEQTDAAIAELNGSRHYCAGEILSLFQQITGDTLPHLGMLVQKFGRSTGFTWGFVDGLYFSSAIEYNDGIVQVFEDQIHIAPVEKGVQISKPGDSGALWVVDTKTEGYKAVGLHFAGDLPHSAFGEYALANPIRFVMQKLDFSFRPGFLEIRDEDALPPPPPLLVQERGGPGVHPAGFGRRLNGSSGQPDPVQPGAGG